VQIEAIPETPENEKYLAGLGLKSSIPSENLPKGAKVLVIAYKKNGNTYTFHKEHIFEVGKKSEFKLDGQQNYTFLIASFGSERYGIAYSVGDYDEDSVFPGMDHDDYPLEVFYQRIDDFVATNGKKLDIKLKRGVSVRLNIQLKKEKSWQPEIIRITNAKLEYVRPWVIRLKDFYVTKTMNGYTTIPIEFSEGMTSSYSTPFTPSVGAGIDDATIGVYISFDMELRDENHGTYIRKVRILTKLKKRGRITFNIVKNACGAYLGPRRTNFIEIMCANLGARYFDEGDESILNASSQETGGDRYYWGYNKIVGKDEKPQKTSTHSVWPSYEDPCPEGYRIISADEWQAIFDNASVKELKIDGKNVGWKYYNYHYDENERRTEKQIILRKGYGPGWTCTSDGGMSCLWGTCARYIYYPGSEKSYHKPVIWPEDSNKLPCHVRCKKEY